MTGRPDSEVATSRADGRRPPAAQAAPAPSPPPRGGSADSGRPPAAPGASRPRSPLVAPGLAPALLTTVLAALLAAAAPLGRPVSALPVALLQAVTAAGWFRLNGMWPARQGIALAWTAGLAADAALLATDGAHAPTVLAGTLGVWWLLLTVLHLGNRSAPDERLAALTATASATIAAALPACLLTAGASAVVAGAAAVAAAVCARALPLPSPAAVAVALPAAVAACLGALRLLPADGGDGTAAWALFGLAVGVAALLGHRVASYDFPSRVVHLTAGVALPLAAAAPLVALPALW